MAAYQIGERGVLFFPPSRSQWHAQAHACTRACASAFKKQVEAGASPGKLL